MMEVMEKQASRKARKMRSKRAAEMVVQNPARDSGGGHIVAELKSKRNTSQKISQASNSFVDQVVVHATEVLGSRDEAMRWLGTPVRGLDFATPISVLATEDGARRVNDILGQMEHGVW